LCLDGEFVVHHSYIYDAAAILSPIVVSIVEIGSLGAHDLAGRSLDLELKGLDEVPLVVLKRTDGLKAGAKTTIVVAAKVSTDVTWDTVLLALVVTNADGNPVLTAVDAEHIVDKRTLAIVGSREHLSKGAEATAVKQSQAHQGVLHIAVALLPAAWIRTADFPKSATLVTPVHLIETEASFAATSSDFGDDTTTCLLGTGISNFRHLI